MWAVSPIQAIGNGLKAAWESYVTLFAGAFGSPAKIIAAIQGGDALEIRRAFNPFFESLVKSIPYMFAGLAVALGFRTGLFNIGVEGQIFMGGIFSVWVGYTFTGLPAIIHVPLAFLAGALGGALWGFIPGLLKAKTGGHEVINTIMMNYIAFRLTDWLLREPMKSPGSTNPISPVIEDSARLPQFFADPIRFHLGFFVALAVAALVYWFLFKTKWGFDLRTVGANPRAARYAGHEHRQEHDCGDVALGRAGRDGRRQRAAGREPSPVANVLSGLRVRQHRAGAAWQEPPGGRGTFGAAVWHAAQRRDQACRQRPASRSTSSR